MDIPYGPGSKMPLKEKAEELGRKFVDLGSEVEMNVKYILTDGTQPIGNGVGPILEAKDVLNALSGKGPKDLADKSVMMAGAILEFCGKVPEGQGEKVARKCLEDGTALKKMREIIKMQGGNPDVKPEDLTPGRFSEKVMAETGGRVLRIDNNLIARLARYAGAPKDPAAGLYLEKKVGDEVGAGDVLYTIYSENPEKLDQAAGLLKGGNGFEMG